LSSDGSHRRRLLDLPMVDRQEGHVNIIDRLSSRL
jgi:hypothetical protein